MSCLMLLKLAPSKALRVKMLKISTWFSQLAEVGVKWSNTFGCAASHASQRLNRRLLVDAQYHGVHGWVQVQSDYIGRFLGECRVFADAP